MQGRNERACECARAPQQGQERARETVKKIAIATAVHTCGAARLLWRPPPAPIGGRRCSPRPGLCEEGMRRRERVHERHSKHKSARAKRSQKIAIATAVRTSGPPTHLRRREMRPRPGWLSRRPRDLLRVDARVRHVRGRACATRSRAATTYPTAGNHTLHAPVQAA